QRRGRVDDRRDRRADRDRGGRTDLGIDRSAEFRDARARRVRVRQLRERGEVVRHHWISRSACSEPAPRSAWTIAIRSRGETPMVLSARTTDERVAAPAMNVSCLPFSLALTVEL